MNPPNPLLSHLLALPLLVLMIVAPSAAFGMPLQWSGNGHYYDWIGGYISWADAKTAAEGLTHLGMQGYLATITSADEQSYIYTNFPLSGWIGASDVDEEGVWKWVTGPEAGIQFWQGDEGGSVTPPFNYANWLSGQPNNFGSQGEDYAVLRNVDGKWNDSAGWATAPRYFVEYGGIPIPEPATLLLLGSGLAGLGLIRWRKRV